tara:strand:+ start:96 stop:1661 length:1566 start_codon:yes stop_codon:yes gene_type:complete
MASVKEFILNVVTGGAQKDIANVKGKLDGAAKSSSNLAGGIKKSTFSLKAFGKALFATGIGAFVIAIGAMIKNLQNSEAGFNRVQKLLSQLGVIAGNVTDIFYSLGTALFQLVTFKFEEASKSFQEATDRIKNFGEETKREIALAGELADQQADLAKKERELIVERAKANRERADLLEKAADKENFTAEQRIKFLEAAGKVDEEITNKEIEAAKIRLELKKQQNSLSESSKEDLDEEARLQAELTNLETTRLTKLKTVTAQITSARREDKALRDAARREEEAQLKAEADEKAKKEEEEKKLKAEQKKKEDEEEKARLDQIAKEKLERDERIAASEVYTQNLITTAKHKAVDQAISLFGAETAAGKAALIAKQVLAAQEMIQEAKKTITFSSLVAARSSAAVAEGTAQTAKVGFPQNIPLLISYALQAVGIVSAVASAVGKSKSVAASLGAGGGTTPSISSPTPRGASQPPDFNIVGAAPESQLAQAISGQGQRPIKAFVVSNEVTTQQALDRNIEQNASIG